MGEGKSHSLLKHPQHAHTDILDSPGFNSQLGPLFALLEGSRMTGCVVFANRSHGSRQSEVTPTRMHH